MFDDVYLVDDHLSLIDGADLDRLERHFGLSFPAGYREMLSVLGVGTYCDIVWTFPPNRVIEETESLRQLWDEHFFWERGDELLTKSQVLKSIAFARSLDGDEIILCPESPQRLYVLPRHNDTIYWLDPSFSDPLDWRSEQKAVLAPPPFRYFEPSCDREWIELFTADTNHDIDHLDHLFDMVCELFGADGETRRIDEPECELLFVKAIGGRIQFTFSGASRIGIRIDYSRHHSSAVDNAIDKLAAIGFHKMDSHE